VTAAIKAGKKPDDFLIAGSAGSSKASGRFRKDMHPAVIIQLAAITPATPLDIQHWHHVFFCDARYDASPSNHPSADNRPSAKQQASAAQTSPRAAPPT
jgi:hypothetical protein